MLAAEILQYIINGLKDKEILKLPIPQPTSDFLIVQYADYTLLIMQADARQLFCLKAILNSFASSTGLAVNFSKSLLVPINVSSEKMKVLAGTLGCQIGSFPFTYLGLPLGTTKPKIEEFAPLLDRVEKNYLPAPLFFLILAEWNTSILCSPQLLIMPCVLLSCIKG